MRAILRTGSLLTPFRACWAQAKACSSEVGVECYVAQSLDGLTNTTQGSTVSQWLPVTFLTRCYDHGATRIPAQYLEETRSRRDAVFVPQSSKRSQGPSYLPKIFVYADIQLISRLWAA